jgi:hypothetical protein
VLTMGCFSAILTLPISCTGQNMPQDEEREGETCSITSLRTTLRN